MGFIDWIRNDLGLPARDTVDVEEAAEVERLRDRLDDADIKIEELEESLLAIADAFDNVGWSPLDSESAVEMPLATVKKVSEIARAMDAVNPFIKRGVNARIAYIWGNGVEFEKVNETVKKAIARNRNSLFSQQAYEERERAAATDGNVFTALHRDNFSVFRIPLNQISGSISNPDNPEEIWYFKRQWVEKSKNRTNEVEKSEERTRWYPSLQYAMRLDDEGKTLPTRWGRWGVDQNYVVQHDSVNKQIGWRWGVPDIMAVIYWAKAYKEYLEDNATMVKAYSRMAWQIKAASTGAANAASAAWTRPPMRNPLTGEVSDIGAAAITGNGTEAVPIGLNASAVDFSSGSPMAAAIASGLEISLDVILSTAENSGQGSTLDLPTLKAMETRQKLWTNSFLDLFMFWGDDDAKITWRNIDEDETHRRIQSVQLAYDGGLLHQEEARKEALELLRIVPTSDAMPVAPKIVAAELAAETQQKVAETSNTVVPGQGQSGSVGSINSGRGQVKEAVKKSMSNK